VDRSTGPHFTLLFPYHSPRAPPHFLPLSDVRPLPSLSLLPISSTYKVMPLSGITVAMFLYGNGAEDKYYSTLKKLNLRLVRFK
jgi:hypothetical protein